MGGAVVEKGDKLKRTALTHAVINGQTHVVAMLLRRGASPLKKDTSGNAAAHYAAAYGWSVFDFYFALIKGHTNEKCALQIFHAEKTEEQNALKSNKLYLHP